MTPDVFMGGTFLLHRAAVPAVLAEGAPGTPDDDGLLHLDLRIEGGRIAGLAPAAATVPDGAVDLEGGMVWPGLVESHAHLDKGHILPRARNPDHSHPGAAAAVAADRRAHWHAEDVRRRFTFGLRCAWANGVVAIRTHLDSHGPQGAITWPVFERLRDEWRDRITLQGVAMVIMDQYATPEGEALAARVAAAGGLLGGTTRVPDSTPAKVDAWLDALFALALRHGLDIDLHVDESGDPAADTLGAVARAVLRHRFPGRVTCGHCCSLAVQAPGHADRVMDLVAEAGMTIVSLASVNMFLQDRQPGRTPRWRGVTLLHELRARGIEVLLGGDNCRDPFHSYGDHDLIETFTDAVRIGHLDLPVDDWPAAVARRAGAWLGVPHGVVGPGAPADLVLMRSRTVGELLARRRGPRTVLRAGRPIDTALPDHRELDDLFA